MTLNHNSETYTGIQPEFPKSSDAKFAGGGFVGSQGEPLKLWR